MPVTSPHRNEGFALLSALVGLAILLVLVSSMVVISQFGVTQSHTGLERSQAEALADGILTRTVLAMQDARQSERPRVDGVPGSLSVLGLSVGLVVEDEFGKVDLNAATPLLLSRLFQTTGLSAVRSDEVVAGVDEWRKNEKPLNTEATLFEATSTRRIFRLTDELLRFEGVDRQIFAAIEPALTVYSGQDHIEQSAAPARALMASLGISADQADLMIKQRSADDPSSALSVFRKGKILPGVDQRGWPFQIDAAFALGGQSYCLNAIVRPTGSAGGGYVVMRRRFGSGRCGGYGRINSITTK